MMKLTGRCKEDFETWYLENYPTRYSKHKHAYKVWIGESWDVPSTVWWLPKSMLWGLLFEFFTLKGIHLIIGLSFLKSEPFKYKIYKDLVKKDMLDFKGDGTFSTLVEAQSKAIEKADKLYNKKKD